MQPAGDRPGKFPERAFIGVVAVVCVGLVISAVLGFVRLSRLREEYMRNRGNDVALELDRRTRGPEARAAERGPGARGPGGRSNPLFWQEAFNEVSGEYQDSVAFFALVDENGDMLASAGKHSLLAAASQAGFARAGGTELYVYDWQPGPGRSERAAKGYQFGGRRVRIGLYASAADAIRAQAYLQLVVTAAAIIVLAGLTYYLLRMLHRFLDLQARQESARHLTALGTMAATLAHEIRNPLGAMKGLTQLAQENLSGDHAAQPFMKTVVSEAERLEKLVTDLLSFARPRKPSFERFDFGHMLEDIRTQMRSKPEAAGKTIELAPESDSLFIYSDPDGVRQILLNMVVNAIEVTPEGGRVVIKAGMDRGRDLLVVEVKDDGPGLGDRDPKELFEPFVTSKTKGTGLGLPVSRRIAAAIGGTLTLHNRPGGGARCVLRVPTQPAAS